MNSRTSSRLVIVLHSWMAALALLGTASVAQVEVVAFDCELAPFGRDAIALGALPDINELGQVAFVDANGVYRLNTSGSITIIAERGAETACPSTPDEPEYLVSFGQRARINDSGRVAWHTSNVVFDPMSPCLDLDTDCAGGVGCGAHFLRPGTYTGNGSAIELETDCCLLPGEQFEILESGDVVYFADGPFPCPGGDSKQRLVSSAGVVIAEVGEALPGAAGTFGCSGFDLFSEFVAGPTSADILVSTSADLPSGSCRNALVDLGGASTITTCETSLGTEFFSTDYFRTPDYGSVSFSSGDRTVVAIGQLASNSCGSSTSEALVEFNLDSGEHAVLVETGETYGGLGGGQLLSFDGFDTGSGGADAGDGRVVFSGEYACDGPRAAVFLADGVGQVCPLVRAGDPLPEPFESWTYSAFGEPAMNDDGEIVFWAQATDERSGELRGGIFTLDASGVSCSVSLEVTRIELNQSVQTIVDDVPLVAKKPTLVRAYLDYSGSSEPQISGVTGKLTIHVDGSVFTDSRRNFNGPINVLPEEDQDPDAANHTLNWIVEIPESTNVDFSVALETDLSTSGAVVACGPSLTRDNVTFECRKLLTLGYVEVKYCQTGAFPDGSVAAKGDRFIRAAFPVPAVDYNEFPRTQTNQDISSLFGIWFFFCELEHYRNSLPESVRPEFLFGWIPPVAADGTTIGRTWGGHTA